MAPVAHPSNNGFVSVVRPVISGILNLTSRPISELSCGHAMRWPFGIPGAHPTAIVGSEGYDLQKLELTLQQKMRKSRNELRPEMIDVCVVYLSGLGEG